MFFNLKSIDDYYKREEVWPQRSTLDVTREALTIKDKQ